MRILLVGNSSLQKFSYCEALCTQMFRVFVFLTACSICCFGDDPRDISNVLRSHIKSHVQYLPSSVYLGYLSFRDIVMPDARVGDLKTIRLVGRAWIWRKFIWFSVFGDLTFEDMYLSSSAFTMNGRNHTGKIEIGENVLRFNWEAVDHFRCTIVREQLDWLPLRKFSLKEGKTMTELIFSDEEVFSLKNSLLNEEFVNRIRDVLLPCLHPKYPISYSWEDREYYTGKE